MAFEQLFTSDTEFLGYVYIRFNVKKDISAGAVETGNVARIRKTLKIFGYKRYTSKDLSLRFWVS